MHLFHNMAPNRVKIQMAKKPLELANSHLIFPKSLILKYLLLDGSQGYKDLYWHNYPLSFCGQNYYKQLLYLKFSGYENKSFLFFNKLRNTNKTRIYYCRKIPCNFNNFLKMCHQYVLIILLRILNYLMLSRNIAKEKP